MPKTTTEPVTTTTTEPAPTATADEQELLQLKMEKALRDYHELVRCWKGEAGVRSIVGDREARRAVDNLETSKREAFVAAALAYQASLPKP